MALAAVSYLLSGESGARRRGVVERVGRYIPLQSLKILIVAWQILTQVRERNGSVEVRRGDRGKLGARVTVRLFREPQWS